jgi:hypothetical protein
MTEEGADAAPITSAARTRAMYPGRPTLSVLRKRRRAGRAEVRALPQQFLGGKSRLFG